MDWKWIWTHFLSEGRVVKKAPLLFAFTVLVAAALGSYVAYEVLDLRYQDRLQSKEEQIELLTLKAGQVTTDVQVTTENSGPPALVRTEPTELVLQFPGGTTPPVVCKKSI